MENSKCVALVPGRRDWRGPRTSVMKVIAP
jgi:hypothetical protein